MANEPKLCPPLEYGVEIDFDETQRKQLDDLAIHPVHRDKAAKEIQDALAEFAAKVLGVLNKNGVKGIQDDQVTTTAMKLIVDPPR